ncbi:MAG: DUF354 domain-containing protein [Methanococcoides sp.]|nr:DUF354 domain-containing protein [Methanococcoides sp.]
MRVLIDIGHPAHVHFFKNTIFALKEKGHSVLVTALDKEVALDLLDKFDIDHIVVGKKGKPILNLLFEWAKRDYSILRIARKFDPDLLMGISNPCIAHSAWLLRKSSLIFDDTEHASFAHKVTYPFADHICTPSCFMNHVGPKQISYEGFHELAYLAPNYFTPDPEVLNGLGLKENDRFIILRFVSLGASHDVGHHGIQNKLEFVKELEKYVRVLITSEADLGSEFEKYKIKVSPDKFHDLLYYATLCIGDGGTTAAESAVLGTPSIYISSLVGTMGNFIELEEKYGLMFSFSSSNEGLKKAIELLQDPDLKEKGRQKRDDLLADKIDVTEFMVKYIETYGHQ